MRFLDGEIQGVIVTVMGRLLRTLPRNARHERRPVAHIQREPTPADDFGDEESKSTTQANSNLAPRFHAGGVRDLRTVSRCGIPSAFHRKNPSNSIADLSASMSTAKLSLLHASTINCPLKLHVPPWQMFFGRFRPLGSSVAAWRASLLEHWNSHT
jgi:hypothetical protein